MDYISIALKEEYTYNLYYALKSLSSLSDEIIAETACIAYNFAQAKEILDMIEFDEYETVDEAFDYLTRFD